MQLSRFSQKFEFFGANAQSYCPLILKVLLLKSLCVVCKLSTIVHSKGVGGQNWVKLVHVVVECPKTVLISCRDSRQIFR